MSGKILLALALVTAASLAAGPRGTVPKAGANHYAAHAEKGGVSVGATMLTSDEARKVLVSEVNRCCVVVEVALYPVKDKPQVVSLDDFSVRVVGSDAAVKPSSAKVVAATIQKSAESQRDITVSPSAGVGYASGPYGGHGTYKEVGVVVEVSEPGAHSGSSERDRDTMQTELSEKGLPEGATSAPVAGYVYFSLTKKKNTTLQLEYVLNGEKVTLPLP